MKWLLQGNTGGGARSPQTADSQASPNQFISKPARNIPNGVAQETPETLQSSPNADFPASSAHLRSAPHFASIGTQSGWRASLHFLLRLHSRPPPSTGGFQSQLRPQLRVESSFRPCKPASLGHKGSWELSVAEGLLRFSLSDGGGRIPSSPGKPKICQPPHAES